VGMLINYEFLEKVFLLDKTKMNLFFSFDPPKPPLIRGELKGEFMGAKPPSLNMGK